MELFTFAWSIIIVFGLMVLTFMGAAASNKDSEGLNGPGFLLIASLFLSGMFILVHLYNRL